MLFGPQLEQRQGFQAGDFVYIAAAVLHLVANSSQTEPLSGILARTDPNEQESVVLRPDLEPAAEGR